MLSNTYSRERHGEQTKSLRCCSQIAHSIAAECARALLWTTIKEHGIRGRSQVERSPNLGATVIIIIMVDSPPSPSVSPFLLHGSQPRRPAVEALKELLNRTLRIACSDGRVFVGTFVCVDKQLNIILANADEYSVSKPDGRYVTMVMVPWRLVVSVCAPNDADGECEEFPFHYYYY